MSKKIVIAALLLTTLPATASAASPPRYNALKYSCDKIQSLIEKHGAAIFRYPSPRNPSLTLYDRYVRDQNYCLSYQVTDRVLIPSADTDQCPVWHCKTWDCDRDRLFCY